MVIAGISLPLTSICNFSVYDFDSHASCSTSDHAHSCFKGCCIQVFHLQLGDFLNLSFCYFCNFCFVRYAGTGFDVSCLLKKAAKIKSGSGVPNKTKVAKVTKAQVQEIAELKMKDLNAASLEAAMSMIAGTARSMGIEVVD